MELTTLTLRILLGSRDTNFSKMEYNNLVTGNHYICIRMMVDYR
jgi:hypothetical protein